MMHRFSVLNLWLLLLVILHVGTSSLRAAEAVREFDIPAGRATEKLKVAALQGNVEVLISTDVSRSVRTKSARGRMTAQAALDQMLEDTPFVAVPVSGGKAFGILYKSSPPPRGTSGENAQKYNTQLIPPSSMETTAPRRSAKIPALFKTILVFAFTATPQLPAQQAAEEVIALSPFEVQASGENSLWTVNQSSGGTRVAVALKELPFTLDVLTTEFMDDFIVSDLSEVLSQVGNVSGMESYTGAGSGNSVRGFSQYYQLRNGFYRNGVIDKTLISRVEVIKGPYAAIYGRGEPGGVINYISKRPVLGTNAGKLIFEVGENNTARVQFEHNLTLSSKTALLVATSYLERDFDQMFTHERTKNFGAVLRHRFSSKTEILLEYEYMERRNNRGRPVADIRIDGTDPSDGTRNKYTGEFAFDFMEQYGWVNTLGPNMYSDRILETLNLTLTHRFAPNVNLRVAYNDSSTTQDYDYSSNGPSTILVNGTTGEFTRWSSVPYPIWRQLPSDVRNVQADLTVDFETGEVKHSTLLTFDYSTQLDGKVSERGARGRATDVHTVAYAPGTIPNYQTDVGSLHGPRTDPIPNFDLSINYQDTPQYYTWLQENRTLDYDITGVFLMHRAKFFNEKLLLMAGGRYDTAETVIINRLSPDKVTEVGRTESKVDDLTYNIGLNYFLTPQSVLYGSHATSFNPKGDVFSDTGLPMPNERGEGYEFGFRTQVLDNRFDVGASYFQIERQNIRIGNPDFDRDFDSPSDKPEYIAGGLDRATGYELYANGKLTDSLSLRFSAGAVDAKHVKSLDAWRDGLSLQRVPDWNYAIGASYRLRAGALKGLSLNASYREQSGYRLQTRSPTATDLRNDLRAERGDTLDLSAGYGWRSGDRVKHTLRVALKNALDNVFIEGSGYYSLGRLATASYTLEY